MIQTLLLVVIIILLFINLYFAYQAGRKKDEKKFVAIETSIDAIDKSLSKFENSVKDEFARNREETGKNSKDLREEVGGSFKSLSDSMLNRLDVLTKSNDDKLGKMTDTIEVKLKSIQDDNNEKLEKMRQTVDEKLHKTLEERLGESFKLVSERLELVHKGLGEMQTLAAGVGDLKKVLSNVKTRGTLGEYQLENILEQLLTADQYAKNVATIKGSSERVEFAIKLPGRDKIEDIVWLPVDSKFPLEKYHMLLDAYESGSIDMIEQTNKELEKAIRISAKDIRDKYLSPPDTTDFAIMFLPVEGLYAEVVRRTDLFDTLQREYKVTITGPTTLAAFLNSLRMGFRTLAIESRSSEVWSLLGAVKTEFGKFGDMLDGVRKNLETAANKISDASRKSRTIERKLRDVQELPAGESAKFLGAGDESDLTDNEESENL
ncbi:MAG: DNA recombination protein RmuC [Candidatus Schekmanbacteria bacterium]|nr:DNA recombination protein RmuC [Candidatus Schekmanbacteria bacterium]